MKEKFADWELTKLLPEHLPFVNISNSYKNYIIHNEEFGDFISCVDMKNSDYFFDYYKEGYDFREAWDFEDIRKYLLKNNYYIVIDIIVVEDEIKYESIVYTKDKDGELTCSKSYFSNNYEECRILAIKHCLRFLKLMSYNNK